MKSKGGGINDNDGTDHPAYHVKRLGREGEPVVILDHAVRDPGALVGALSGVGFTKNSPYYPGIRAPFSAGYLSEIMDTLTDVLTSEFDIQTGAKLVECNASIVTSPPDTLRPIQRLPHFDSHDGGRIALLHYLCGPRGDETDAARSHGGTAFYRQRATGFETVTEARMAAYQAALQDSMAQHGLPEARYFGSDMPYHETTVDADTDSFGFERTGLITARYNRLIIYRGRTLHSGYIPAEYDFNPDPREGRLTINTFLQAKR